MFDLIAGREKHLPSHATVPLLLSTSAQAAVIALIFVLPLLFMTERLPEVPTMMAFVAEVPAPPPPPRRPRWPRSRSRHRRKPSPRHNRISSSRHSRSRRRSLRFPNDEGFDAGVPGGVEGGIPEGSWVALSVVGLKRRPPSATGTDGRRAPVRIGGQIKQPQLLKGVEPEYPPLAVEGTHSRYRHPGGNRQRGRRDGRETPEVGKSAARSRSRDRAAAMALFTARPQRNPVPFVLTVTLSFPGGQSRRRRSCPDVSAAIHRAPPASDPTVRTWTAAVTVATRTDAAPRAAAKPQAPPQRRPRPAEQAEAKQADDRHPPLGHERRGGERRVPLVDRLVWRPAPAAAVDARPRERRRVAPPARRVGPAT